MGSDAWVQNFPTLAIRACALTAFSFLSVLFHGEIVSSLGV